MDDYRGNKADCSSDTGGHIQIWHLNEDAFNLQKSVSLFWCGHNAWNTKRSAWRVQLNETNMSANFLGPKEHQWMVRFEAAVFTACSKQCSHYDGTQRPKQNLTMFWHKYLANCPPFIDFACNTLRPLGLRTIDFPLQLELKCVF